MEAQQVKLVGERQAELTATARHIGVSTPLTQEQLLKEILATMSQRKKLRSHVNRLENELNVLEKGATQTNVSAREDYCFEDFQQNVYVCVYACICTCVYTYYICVCTYV